MNKATGVNHEKKKVKLSDSEIAVPKAISAEDTVTTNLTESAGPLNTPLTTLSGPLIAPVISPAAIESTAPYTATHSSQVLFVDTRTVVTTPTITSGATTPSIATTTTARPIPTPISTPMISNEQLQTLLQNAYLKGKADQSAFIKKTNQEWIDEENRKLSEKYKNLNERENAL